MENWITPAVLAAAVTGFFTYMGTRRSTENVYTGEIRELINSYKEEVLNLRRELNEVKQDLNAKDDLILELKTEKTRLLNETTELKKKVRILRGEDTNG